MGETGHHWPIRIQFTPETRQTIPSPDEDLAMSETSPEPRASLLQRIQLVLDREVRGVLAPEGDAVQVVDLDSDNVLLLRLSGACGSCASSAASLSMMIEQLVRAEVPEVRFVEAVP